MRRAYGGNVMSNAAAYAPVGAAVPLGAFGGDEHTWGAPARLVMTADPRMANYLPAEQIPSRWAAPVVANLRYTTLTNPPQGPLLRRISRDIHVPMPVQQRATTTSGVISSYYQGGGAGGPGRARAPRGIATPTPSVRPRFRLFGPNEPTT
jgi:hypothetical protein